MKRVSRLGFPVNVVARDDLKSNDARRHASQPHLKVSLEYVDEIVDHLDRHDIRMSSDLAPYATHPDLPAFHSMVQESRAELKAIGDKAKKLCVRLSFHPSQYVVLNSPDPELVCRSVLDLLSKAEMLDLMELNAEAVVVIHVGGTYGDIPSSRARWVETWKTLPEPVRRRLVLEHDDLRFSAADVLRFTSTHVCGRSSTTSISGASIQSGLNSARCSLRSWRPGRKGSSQRSTMRMILTKKRCPLSERYSESRAAPCLLRATAKCLRRSELNNEPTHDHTHLSRTHQPNSLEYKQWEKEMIALFRSDALPPEGFWTPDFIPNLLEHMKSKISWKEAFIEILRLATASDYHFGDLVNGESAHFAVGTQVHSVAASVVLQNWAMIFISMCGRPKIGSRYQAMLYAVSPEREDRGKAEAWFVSHPERWRPLDWWVKRHPQFKYVLKGSATLDSQHSVARCRVFDDHFEFRIRHCRFLSHAPKPDPKTKGERAILKLAELRKKRVWDLPYIYGRHGRSAA